MDAGVSVVIPVHGARVHNGMLGRAVRSVFGQTRPPEAIIIENDTTKRGAAHTRTAGLMKVTTEWVAFLDSDDALDPGHLQQLLDCAATTGADYVYPHYRVEGGTDPRPWMLGRPWSDDDPQQTTITVLVRTEMAQQVGFPVVGDLLHPGRTYAGEDYEFTLGCMKAGAVIVHHPQQTWTWVHHGKNSGGLPTRGDAR